MGISMGGATLIQAAHDGAKLDGLILLDSLLDTNDTFAQGAWVHTGLPPALFAPSAWAATQFFGLPGDEEQALARAATLELPILAIQDPDDPVTRARYSRELAQRNPRVTLWLVPAIDPANPDLASKARWGTHVSAFLFYPRETVAQIMAFIDVAIDTVDSPDARCARLCPTRNNEKNMYHLATTIPNEIDLNLIPEVTFHPDGSKFAVSYQRANEVVVYDARSRGVVRIFRNPEAGIDNPHGVLLTDAT